MAFENASFVSNTLHLIKAKDVSSVSVNENSSKNKTISGDDGFMRLFFDIFAFAVGRK
jgi:hypothetical protein